VAGQTDPFEELATALVARVERHGARIELEEARDILWEIGVADLLEDLSVARSVIQAADGFHPVARFFVEGSEEHEFILRVLRSERDATTSSRRSSS
jgi:hypothetical protein